MIGLGRRDPLDELAAILAEQRAALRGGQVQVLADLVPRMERALARLRGVQATPRLVQLRQVAAENAALLRAAGDGVAAVRDLRGAAAKTRLSTYTATGHMTQQAGSPGRTLSRR